MFRQILLLFIAPYFCSCKIAAIEDAIFKEVLTGYNKMAYPGTSDNLIVIIYHGLSLINFDEGYGARHVIHVWEYMSWNDPRLIWNGEPKAIRLPLSEIWTPDIVFISGSSKRTFEPKAVISRDGNVTVTSMTELRSNTPCIGAYINECSFQFRSWTYDVYALDIQVAPSGVDLSMLVPDPNYKTDSRAFRNVSLFVCCPEPFVDITYKLHLMEKNRF